MLHTMFEVQSIHLQAALWMGMSLSQIKKIPSFWQWPPPSPQNNWGPTCTFFPFFIVFVKDSILDNWLQKRAPEARGKSSAKRERRRRESLPEAQEIPRSGETNSQFLALNSCKAHTSLISCSYLVYDTVYLLLCVGKFFFHPTRTSFFFLPMWVKFFFFLLCVGQVFFFLPLSGSSFFFYKNFLLPPLKSNGASLSAKFVPLKYYTLSSQLQRLASFSVGCSGRRILSPGQINIMRKWCKGTFLNFLYITTDKFYQK